LQSGAVEIETIPKAKRAIAREVKRITKEDKSIDKIAAAN